MFGALRQKNRLRWTTSPMLCSTDRFCNASICPPTSIGLFANRANVSARCTLSGSNSMSSSRKIRWVASLAVSISYIARENPPLPPRFGWSTSRSRLPSAAATSAKRAVADTLSVP